MTLDVGDFASSGTARHAKRAKDKESTESSGSTDEKE
jgi:hypothetical protein